MVVAHAEHGNNREVQKGRFVYELAIQQNKNFVESSGGGNRYITEWTAYRRIMRLTAAHECTAPL